MTDELLNNKDDNSDISKDEELIDKVEALPKEEKRKLTMSLSMYSGPIPHPDILKGYEKLYSGAAKKMIDNGLEESVHRRTLETKRQKRRGSLAFVSLFALILFTIMLLIFSFLLIINDHAVIGTVFALGDFFWFVGKMDESVDKLSSNNDLNSNSSDSTDDKEDNNKK